MAELGRSAERAPRGTLLAPGGALASALLLSQTIFGSSGAGPEDAAAFPSRHSKATRRRKRCVTFLLSPPLLPPLAADLNVKNYFEMLLLSRFPQLQFWSWSRQEGLTKARLFT